jgi:hypothetical protein
VNNMENNIWTHFGMSIWEWRDLPLEKKKELAASVGIPFTPPRPPEIAFSGSFLLDAYFRKRAEEFTIRYNFPHAVLDCDE